MKVHTAAEVRQMIEAGAKEHGSMVAYCRAKGMSRQQVWVFLTGSRSVPPKILEALGLVKVVRYTQAASS